MALTKVKGHIIADDLALGGNPTTSTQSASDNSTKIATTAYVTTAVSNLVDGAPSTLNTLNEIAAALNDDAALNTTLTNSIATKAPLASPTFTGNVSLGAASASSGTLYLYNSGNDSRMGILNTGSEFQFESTYLTSAGYKPITFKTGGSERMRIDSAGKVGIGTDTPVRPLHLSTTTGGSIIHLTDNSTGHTATDGVDIQQEGTLLYILNREAGDIRFGTSATERMRIDSSGNVGIGETSPDGLLHLKGGTATGDASHILFENTQGDKVFAIGGGSTGVTNSHLYFRNVTDNTRPMVITDAGNIGIGGIIPVSKLHLESANVGTNGAVVHFLQNVATNGPTLLVEQTGGGGNSNVNHGLLVKVDGQNGGLGNAFQVVGTNNNLNSGNDIKALTVKNGGNVGIGTDTPAQTLDVKGRMQLTRPVASGHASEGNWDFNISHEDAARYGSLYITPSVSTAEISLMSNKFRFTNTGRLGIGTATPARLLEVTGNAGKSRFTRSGSTGTTMEFYSGGSQAGGIQVQSTGLGISGTNGENQLFIKAGGNVGIGTSSPGAFKLVLEGTDSQEGLKIHTGASSSQWLIRAEDNAGNQRFVVKSTGDAHFNGGHVGIGTSSPTIGKLQVHGGGASNLATLHLQSDTSTTFNHSINSFNSNLTNGENNLFVLGKEGSTKNSAWIGYKWRSAGSDTNQLTFGHWGNNNIVNLLGNGHFGIGTETPTHILHVYRYGQGDVVKFEGTTGYGAQGSHNASYYHHFTDRAMNYWDKPGYFSGGAHTYSDSRLKENVATITGALDSVAKMNGVTFTWINGEKKRGPDGKQFGVLAQNMLEVDSALPTLAVDPLAEGGNEDKDDKLYSMDYSRLTPYFIEAIKELKTKLEAAEARITTLEG